MNSMVKTKWRRTSVKLRECGYCTLKWRWSGR